MLPEIRKVQYFCTDCPDKKFGDPEDSPCFTAWMATEIVQKTPARVGAR